GGAAQAKDEDLDAAVDLEQLVDEALGGSEEDRAFDPEGDDPVVQALQILAIAVRHARRHGAVGEVDGVDLEHRAHADDEQDRRGYQSHLDGQDQVEEHGDDHRQQEHERVGLGAAYDQARRVPLDHPHRDDHQDAAQDRQGDARGQ